MKHLSSNYVKTVFSYLFILAFTLIVTILTYVIIIQAIEDNMIQLKTSSIERKESAISATLSGIEDYIYQYSTNSRVEEMIQADNRNDMKIGMFLDNSKFLPYYESFNVATRNYVLSTLTFFRNSGVIISGSSTYITKNWTEEYIIRGYTPQEWMSVLDTTQEANLFKMDADSAGNGTSLIYRANLPFGSNGSSFAVMLLFLDKDKLETQLLSDINYEGAVAYVLNHDKNIILANGLAGDPPLVDFTEQEKTFSAVYNGLEMTVFHIQSFYNDWTYVWLLPRNQVYSELNNIIFIVAVILVSLMIAGIGITIAMAKHQNRPVKEIVRMLFPESSNTVAGQDAQHLDEFDWIKGNIREMMKQEKSLQGQLMQNKNLVKSAMLDKLLEGRFTDEQAAENALRQIQFPFSNTGYTIIIVQIIENGHYPEAVANTQIQNSVLLSFINSQYPNVLVHAVYYQRIVVFYHNDSSNSRPVNEFAALLSTFVKEKGHTNVMVSVGDTCFELTNIHMSYMSAALALSNSKTNSGVVFSAMTSKESSSLLYYPMDVEQRVISLVSVGDTAGTQALLEQLFKQNLSCLEHRYDLISVFLAELVGTLIKALSAEGLENQPEYKSITALLTLQNKPADEAFQNILEHYLMLCTHIKQNRRDSTSILVKNVTEYIESFFMDQSISLSKLADKFGLSEPYLSHVFKESTGENLSSCLERIRINHAHALLTETAISIDDIAEKVGYYSSDTFRKAFKRYHGITPAMYRSSTRMG